MNSLMLMALACAVGQAAPVADRAETADFMNSLNAYYLQEASGYEFFLDAQQQKLSLQTQPLMHWGLFDDWSGGVYVWTHEGRPALLGCIGSGLSSDKRRSVFHEFHSLLEEPLAPTRIDGARPWVWTPEGAAVEFQEIPDAPAPRSTSAQRGAQMRLLARQFTGYMTHGDERPLRLLPQPLYQFGEGAQHDGAIFAFAWADGTDPELLLLLEARDTGSGLRWVYAPARFTKRALRLDHQGRAVWRAAEYNEQWRSTQLKLPYLTVWIKWVAMNAIQAALEGSSDK
jgi:hypothetical protein